MNNPHGIIVFGANGTGKTTLARELAQLLGYKHIDIEDYAFESSEIPYAAPRTREDCISLMLADIEKYGSFVISTVIGDLGSRITSMYDFAVLLEAPAEIRINRAKQRSYDKYGARVRAGGDMYEQELKFFDFVVSRSLTTIEQWAETLACPIIRADGTVECRLNASNIADFYAKRFISIGLPEFPDDAEIVRRVSARGVCVRDGKALMIKYKWPGYGFSGGGIEAGEGIKDAIIREFNEEIGCNVLSVGKFLMSVTEREISEPGKYFERVSLYYECEVDAESAFTPHPTPEEIEREYDSVWVDLRTALRENEPVPQRERDVAVLKLLLDGTAAEYFDFPPELAKMLAEYTRIKDSVGRSSSVVYRYECGDDILYLKISRADEKARRERKILNWLRGKLPVPSEKFWGEQDNLAYLLITAAKGEMSCESPDDTVKKTVGKTVAALASGILTLQNIDIAACPFDNSLDIKLKEALFNIENDLVDMGDFEEGNDFQTPMDLYNWLCANKPAEELCFSHGDYCLPNIFIDGNEVTGFIDVGNAGIADKYQDIALCVRSLGYNLRHSETAAKDKCIQLFFACLGIKPDYTKIDYYILLDELF